MAKPIEETTKMIKGLVLVSAKMSKEKSMLVNGLRETEKELE
jgi:hypothetical protein